MTTILETYNTKVRRNAIIAFFSLLTFISYDGKSQYSQENLIKAAYLEKFTRFVQWPEEFKVIDTTQPFVIGVFGRSPMNDILAELYKNQKIRKKRVEIVNIKDPQNIIDNEKKIHLVYIPSGSDKWLEQITKICMEKNILTIGDGNNFASRGVHINFIINNKRVHYEINEKAVYDSNLFMSYRLLNSARIVNPE